MDEEANVLEVKVASLRMLKAFRQAALLFGRFL